MICSTSAAHVPLGLSCLLNSSALAAVFEQVIVPAICFLPCLLTRYWFVSCQQHMCHRFRLLCIYGVFAVLLYLALFVNWTLICTMSAALVHWSFLQYNSGSMAADFEQFTVSIRLFFTWALCIYIILNKGCHILYVFSLSSRSVQPHHRRSRYWGGKEWRYGLVSPGGPTMVGGKGPRKFWK